MSAVTMQLQAWSAVGHAMAMPSLWSALHYMREEHERRLAREALSQWESEGGAIHEREDIEFDRRPERLIFWTTRNGRQHQIEIEPESVALFMLALRIARGDDLDELRAELAAKLSAIAPEFLTTAPDLLLALRP